LAHTDVTAEQARELIDSTNDLIVVDVREPSEYCDTKGHIPGALNYPWYSGVLEAQYGELPMDGPVLVVCGSGSRSNRAADFLDSEGFSMVYDMLSGMRVWTWETEPCVDPNSKYAGGAGEPNDPYQIATAEDLILLGETPDDYDKHFILTADIDLDPNLPGRRVLDRAVIAPDTNPIPNEYGNDPFEGTPFSGTFDGDGHRISCLTISGAGYLGLFGQLGSGANISNLGLEEVDVDGTGAVGGLVGWNNGSITTSHGTGSVRGINDVGGLVGGNYGAVTDCYSNGNVSGNVVVGGLLGGNRGAVTDCYSNGYVSGNVSVGGLVGFQDEDGSIATSHSTGTVRGTEFYVGGLVGCSSGGSITTSYSTAAVSGTDIVGGLVGCNDGSFNYASITTSYSTGAVSGDGSVGGLVGGLVGLNNPGGNITKSHSTGAVTANGPVGGLVGKNYGSIGASYSTGTVTGETGVGGLVGLNRLAGSTTASFWDMEASGLATSDGGTGKITAEMQMLKTFLEAGWDFVGETENGIEDIWSICEGTNYPRFVWQIAAGDFVCPDGITVDDFSFFMEHWLDDNCDLSNGYCQGTDLDQSGTVDINDLEIFFELWSAEQK
jgi:rhodanese-related sulfurtransferase